MVLGIVAGIAALCTYIEIVADELIDSTTSIPAVHPIMVVIGAWVVRIQRVTRSRIKRSEALPLLVHHEATLRINEGGWRDHHTSASIDRPLFKRLMVYMTWTVSSVNFRRSPPEGSFGTKNETAEVEISASCSANTEVAVVQAISTELAVATLGLNAESAESLRIGLAAHSDHQCERRQSAGMQSLHVYPFLIFLPELFRKETVASPNSVNRAMFPLTTSFERRKGNVPETKIDYVSTALRAARLTNIHWNTIQ